MNDPPSPPPEPPEAAQIKEWEDAEIALRAEPWFRDPAEIMAEHGPAVDETVTLYRCPRCGAGPNFKETCRGYPPLNTEHPATECVPTKYEPVTSEPPEVSQERRCYDCGEPLSDPGRMPCGNANHLSDPPTQPETWTLTVCPDCGNHRTAFVLCEHMKGDPEAGTLGVRGVEVEVLPLSDHLAQRDEAKKRAEAIEEHGRRIDNRLRDDLREAEEALAERDAELDRIATEIDRWADNWERVKASDPNPQECEARKRSLREAARLIHSISKEGTTS